MAVKSRAADCKNVHRGSSLRMEIAVRGEFFIEGIGFIRNQNLCYEND
jgi:hypothetical protein